MTDAEAAEPDWGIAAYGDPCHECGFGWSLHLSEAIGLVTAMPERYAAHLAGTDGRQRHPDLSWNAGAYVSHVADNLRIWAERLAAAALGDHSVVTPYDDQMLGVARGYGSLPLAGALWSLERAVADWDAAVAVAEAHAVVLLHPERGEQPLLSVVRGNAHDAFHHDWDIRRSLDPQRPQVVPE